jgi:hypothetical protein
VSACQPQTFPGMTPAAWARLKAELAKTHPGIVADAGTETASGYTVTWRYDPAGQTLFLQVLDSPWYAPCSAIYAAINDEVARAMAGP